MRIITKSELEQRPELYQEISETLENDGIICFPVGSSYRLATPFLSPKAVVRFQQIKKRTKKSPVLAFISNREMLGQLTDDISHQANALLTQFWPGPLTLLFELNREIPKKLKKSLNAKGKVGIRVPQDDLALEILSTFDAPLLISSANVTKKAGSYSEAQIRKNFGRWIDILISDGDQQGQQRSTIVDASGASPIVLREGSLATQDLLAALAGAGSDSVSLPSSPPAM